jgi:hypothetical protein
MNRKELLAKSIAIYKDRINQINEKLQEKNLSDRQKSMFESEIKIANEELIKIDTTK